MCENHDKLQHDTYDIHKHQLFREREKQPEVNQKNADQRINAFLYKNKVTDISLQKALVYHYIKHWHVITKSNLISLQKTLTYNTILSYII